MRKVILFENDSITVPVITEFRNSNPLSNAFVSTSRSHLNNSPKIRLQSEISLVHIVFEDVTLLPKWF